MRKHFQHAMDPTQSENYVDGQKTDASTWNIPGNLSTQLPQPHHASASISTTYALEPFQTATQTEHIAVDKESLFHPVKAVEDILSSMAEQTKQVNLLLKQLLLERTFTDKYVQIGLNVNYVVSYETRKYVYILSPINATLVYPQGSVSLLAGVWKNISLARGTSLTMLNGSDSNPTVFLIRECDVPMIDYAGTIQTTRTSDYPLGATPIRADSGNQANNIALAQLSSATGKTTYIAGFSVSGSGATSANVVTVTVSLGSSSLHYTYTFVAGATLANESLIVNYVPPIPATSANMTITASCPASGTGGTNNTVNAWGYTL